MKQFFILIMLVCVWSSTMFAQTETEPNVVIVKFDRSFVENELKPNFKKKSPDAVPSVKSKSISMLNQKHAVKKYIPVFITDPRYAERHKEFDLDLFYRIEYSTNETVEEVCQSFAQGTEVLLAEPNFLNSTTEVVEKKPNDPEYALQWGFKNEDYPGLDINIEEAWQITTGHPDVIVGIIDNCVEHTHKDISSNMWYNFNEIPYNGIDDDGNGYVDDFLGWNFRDGNDNVGPDADVDDSHGTHVAGMVAARSNNGMGIAGAAGGWGNEKGVRMMFFRTGQRNDAGDDRIVYGYQSMVYAADNGAAIVQCSWGGFSLSATGRTSIEYFQRYGGGTALNGGLVVAAVGNNDSNVLFYPSCAPNVLTVGAMTNIGSRSSFSNYGTWVDICAPGTNIYSSVPYNQYGMKNGTSMACPIVSGVAALTLSAALDLPMSLRTPAWLSDVLTRTATQNWWKEDNHSSLIGPLLNAGAAVKYARDFAEDPTANQPQTEVKSVTKIFPNPASDVICIKNSETNATQAYMLFNAKGEIIYQKKSPKPEENIHVETVPTGMYFLRVETANGNYTEKIIIKR